MVLAPVTFRRLCRARDVLRDADAQGLSVAELARQSGISPYHFIRQFQALFGQTPHQLRIAARLERAKELLVADGASVTDVCMTIGFSSVGSFSSLFARRIGASPTAYRRAHVQVPAALSPLVPGCLGMLARLPASLRNFRDA